MSFFGPQITNFVILKLNQNTIIQKTDITLKNLAFDWKVIEQIS